MLSIVVSRTVLELAGICACEDIDNQEVTSSGI